MVAKFSLLAMTSAFIAVSPSLAAAPAGAPGASKTHQSAPITAHAQQQAPKGDLDVWEEKLFGHQFDKDPLDKRIQRLELLLFGGTQDGDYSQRLDNLRSTIASRVSVKVSKAPINDGSLAVIEKRVLKHTYAAQTADQRLSRIEEKIFGKASPAMSIADRIDRLKKTLGIGATPPIAQNPTAEPFGMFGGNQDMMRRFNMQVVPFGDQSMGMPDDMSNQMNQMMRQFNQQMSQMHRRRGPVAPIVPFPRMNPGGGMRQDNSDQKLPPYTDPNAI
ncbi:MAG TPA: hypothetical protein V6C81_18090 [Planktothrix sp.]|jgi:hypothetical protein